MRSLLSHTNNFRQVTAQEKNLRLWPAGGGAWETRRLPDSERAARERERDRERASEIERLEEKVREREREREREQERGETGSRASGLCLRDLCDTREDKTATPRS